MDQKRTIMDLYDLKKAGSKISAVSCYDYTSASMAAEAGIDMILVGDSAAQIMLGYDSTLPATMDFMVAITKAVRRGASNLFITADMPFLSYQASISEAIKNAGRFIVEAGAQLVKIEATAAHIETVKAVCNADIPVMAHIGIRPQSIAKLGRLKAEGTTADLAYDLVLLARKMVEAGAAALLLEGVAREVAAIITKNAPVPVISCGSGPDCDGQILIISDILGLSNGSKPKFSKQYVHLRQDAVAALKTYHDQIKMSAFPTDDLSYHVKKGEIEKLQKMLDAAGN